MQATDAILNFLTTHLGDIIAIVIVYVIGQLLLSIYAKRIAKRTTQDAKNKRAKTIAKLVHDVGHVALMLMIAFWVLRLFGVDPTPILASAGVVGLAIGFGSQALVKDFVSGMFIIAENQYGVGDHIKVNGFEGEVDCLTIRSTVLKDVDGNMIYIPNGSITSVVNVSKK